MAKMRVHSLEERTSEKFKKTFFFLFLPVPHSMFTFYYKFLEVCWDTPVIEKSTTHRNPTIYKSIDKSIDWLLYETCPQCKVFPKRH